MSVGGANGCDLIVKFVYLKKRVGQNWCTEVKLKVHFEKGHTCKIYICP